MTSIVTSKDVYHDINSSESTSSILRVIFASFQETLKDAPRRLWFNA